MQISIITPCYNSEKYLSETIESVISQRGNFEIEYIIVDGLSDDKTVSIIHKYKKMINLENSIVRCNKVTIKFISGKDSGMYDAIVKGFKLVTGDIVAYINSDDFYLPNAFSTVIDAFRIHTEIEWISGIPVLYNDKGQITGGCTVPFNYNSSLIRNGTYGSILPFIQQESTFWRVKLLNYLDFSRFKKYNLAGDFYLWYTFSKYADLYIIHSCIGGFRRCGGQLSEQKTKYYREFNNIAETKSFFYIIKAYLYKAATYFLPIRIKKRLNKKIIFYKNGKWLRNV